MYEEIVQLRKSLEEELKSELNPGVPFTNEHRQVVEARLQTAIIVSTRALREEVDAVVEANKAEKSG